MTDEDMARRILGRLGYVVIHKDCIREYYGQVSVSMMELWYERDDEGFLNAMKLKAMRECAYAAARDAAVVEAPSFPNTDPYPGGYHDIRCIRATMRIIMR
jgi:hypothetical protein